MKNLLSHFNHSSRRPRRVRRWERARACDIRLQNGVINNAQFETLEDRTLLSALSGTYSVGATGNYASLTAAIADIQTQTINGPVVLELQSSYTSTGETFPLTFSNLGTTFVNTLTVRPATGATNLLISSADTTAATVDLNGAQFVTFDGRPGGTGTAKQLTIENTNTSGVALRFITEASGNTFKFVTFKGVNTSDTSGTVLFSTTTGASGNDNNTIDTCDIRDGASTPANGLYSLGTTTTTAQNNSGNTVSNCNVFNFYSPTAGMDAAGVRLDSGNTDWSITSNSFYQTATRTAVAVNGVANVRAIYVNNTSGNNFTVTGNFIGGDSPGAAVTTQKWTTTASGAHLFQGIVLNAGTTTPSSVQGNTITNVVWTSSSSQTLLPGVWSGIYVQAGNVNIGTVTGNTIGSGTGTGFISVTTSATGDTSFGIGSASSGTVAVANNTIGSITTNGSPNTISASLTGIQVTAGTNTISNNTVGSTGTAKSLNAAACPLPSQQVTGILSSSTTSASITGNTVANLNNNYQGSATTGQIRGIVNSDGVNTITGNTIRNLSTTSRNADTGMTVTTGQSVVGIAAISTTAGQTVSQNTVHSLANTAGLSPAGGPYVTGIYYAGPTSGTNIIARNFVHSLALSSGITTSVLNGMQFVAGTFTARNNMVRVGLMADGTSTAPKSTVRGIYDNGTTAGRNFFHNSVYVGGTATSVAVNSFAFDGSSGVSNTCTYQNNIFVNSRNSGNFQQNYAVQYGGTTPNPTGLTAGGNLFLSTNSAFGFYNGSSLLSIFSWQTATGQDATSFNVDPRFINPTGTADTVDLHLQSVNPAEAKGVALAAVTDDFDGQTRSSLTPVDIGADAGNFKYAASSTQLSPVVSFTPAANTNSTANRVLTGFATITDDGIVASGGNAPRLYFKKSTEADAFGGNTSADNGWKFVTAGNASSPYNFTLNYALLTSSARGGDVIQYFVVAQDNAANFASSPSGAGYSSATAPVTTINARPATVQSYRLLSTDLSALTLSSGTLAPGFAANVTSYTATVANIVSSLLVTPTPADSTATVTVTGSTPASPVGLSVGANAIAIVVTASDSTTKTYTVTVTRAAANTAPTAVVLTPSSASLAENASTASAIELSTISITDDGNGTNTLSLSGADAASFEIVSGKLYLKAGVTLDFETKPTYTVTVNADDASVGGPVDASATFTLNLTNVLELSGINVNQGQTQRSFVRYLDILFDAGGSDLLNLISGNRIQLTRFDLDGLNGVVQALPVAPAPAASGSMIQLDFGIQGIGGNRSTNAGNGYYEIAVDMDGNGSFESKKYFHRLFGDVTGDGLINAADKSKVLTGQGVAYSAESDVNGDGSINVADTILVTRAISAIRKLKGGLFRDD